MSRYLRNWLVRIGLAGLLGLGLIHAALGGPGTTAAPQTAAGDAATRSGSGAFEPQAGRLPLAAFGAICDGSPHPLSERFASLDQARRFYPGARSLDDQIDTAALEVWLARLQGTTARGRRTGLAGWIGPGTCLVDHTLYLPAGVDILGAGRAQTSARGVTDLQRMPGMTGDIFRVIPVGDPRNKVLWWDGKLAALRLINLDSTARTGNGINLVDAAGNPVRSDNNTVFEDVIVRGMPENGMRFPIGGLATYFNRVELIFNRVNGLLWIGRADAIQISGASGDANGEAILRFVNTDQSSGVVTITALKSEQAANPLFAMAGRNTPLLIENASTSGASFIVQGISHIRSDPDPSGQMQKPGDAILITGTNRPDLVFEGVNIRVRPDDVGPEPLALSAPALTPPISYARSSSAGRIGNGAFGQVGAQVRSWIGPLSAYQLVAGEDIGLQLQGRSPRLSWLSLDDPGNQVWSLGADGGALKGMVGTGNGAQRSWLEVRADPRSVAARFNATLHARKVASDGGTPLAADNVSLSGWGEGASVTVEPGSDDQHFRLSVIAGRGATINPTIRVGFADADAPWTASGPFMAVTMGSESTGEIAPVTLGRRSPASRTLRYNAKPAAGATYIFECVAIG